MCSDIMIVLESKELFLFPLTLCFLAVAAVDAYGFLHGHGQALSLVEWVLAGVIAWVVT